MITKHEKKVGEYILVWERDDEETYAGNFKDNNLYIEGVWNMSDTLGRTDTCVGMSVTGENTFSFVTFSGLKYEMSVTSGKVELISKKITK
ncbi:MAG: hypothetical protein J6N47_08735 [Lachnospiraceae bacterium]|nr:hypothetical protein [Lachnospiraceae bacterium]